jgi:hypothetical protein
MLNTGVASLERLTDPDNGNFSPDVAKYFLGIDYKGSKNKSAIALKAGMPRKSG